MSITSSKSAASQNEQISEDSLDDRNSLDQPQTGMTSKVVGGSFWALLGQAVMLGASLIFTPFVIRLLGTESYGVLALVNLLISYISFADFGMGTASTKFASEAYAEGNRENEAAIVWTALFIAFIPSVFFAGSLVMLSGYIVGDALKLPDYLQATAAAALIFASVGFVFRTAGLVFNTPQLVRLRMDLVTVITVGTGLTQIIMVPLVIWFGGGLVGAVATIAVFSFINLLCNVAVSRRLLPNLFRFNLQKTLTLPLIKYGGSLVLSSIAGIILISLEKLVLTRYASVISLAHYTVAFTLASLMTIIPVALSQSLFPAFAQMQSEGNKENLLRLFQRAIRGNCIWVPPIIIFLCFIAKPFFTVWAGEEFGRESVVPFYILAFGLAINIIAYVPYSLVLAAGRSDFLAKVYWAELVPYVFLAAALTIKLGASGAALVWSIRVSVDTIIFLYLAKHILKQKIRLFFDLNYAYFFVFMMLMIPGVLILAFSDSIAVTFSSGGILLLLYGLIVWKTVLKDEEKSWIKSQISRFRHISSA